MLPIRLIAAVAVLTLVGCSPIMQGSLDTLRSAVAKPPELVVTRDEVFARPYYQLRLDSPWGSALMALGRVEGSREYWATSTGQVLLIEHGLVRRVFGFPQTLEDTRFVNEEQDGGSGGGTDPFSRGLHQIEDGALSVRELDWMPGYRYGVQVQSRFSRGLSETVKVLDESRELLRIDELISAKNADFTVLNRYWVDPADGFIFVSEQHPLPGMALRLTQLRPYRGGVR